MKAEDYMMRLHSKSTALFRLQKTAYTYSTTLLVKQDSINSGGTGGRAPDISTLPRKRDRLTTP